MLSLPPATKPYQYTVLRSDSAFRLLKLLKGCGNKIECKLLSTSLQEEHPPYEALSYTWGSNELVEWMILDGKLLWVTDNLWSALRSLRRSDRDRILWIDAICINQEDTDERNQQVKQMGRIYETAEKVLFWLGKATKEIISLMEALNEYRDVDPIKLFEEEALRDWHCEEHSVGLQQMLNREWFTRVWILQEVAKAYRADVCCGLQSIPAGLFAHAVSLMEQDLPPHCRPELDIMAKSIRTPVWWTETRDLRELLRRFQASKATNERDKIYALLGLSSDPIGTFTISYEKPTSQVVHEVLTRLLRSAHIDQSKPFAIHEVLNFMSHFRTLDVTYWVAALENTVEAIYPHLQSGSESNVIDQTKVRSPTIAVTKDPALFLLEDRAADNLGVQKTCHNEVVELVLADQYRGTLDDGNPGRGMDVLSWGSADLHIKVIVVHDKKLAILQAATKKCYRVVRQLLHINLETEGEEECEASVLQDLVNKGLHEQLWSMLHEIGADVNAQGGEYGNALQAAVFSGSTSMIKMLLKAGADVNAQGGEYGNALQTAAYRSGTKLVKMLLNAGADVNAQGGKYGNALQAATLDGSTKLIKMLLKAGADVNAQGGEYGNALQTAAYRSGTELVKMLLNAGADVNAQGGQYGNALQAAAWRSSTEVSKMLLEAGADVNAQGGKFGDAARAALRRYNNELVKMLLDAGAHVNTQGVNFSDQKWRTLLCSAAQDGKEAIVQLLLDTGGIDVNLRDQCGRTPLSFAAESGHTAVVELLLQTKAIDVDTKDCFGRTPLLRAAQSGHEEVARLLFSIGKANAGVEDNFGRTALHQAEQKGHNAIAKLLFNPSEANVYMEKGGRTPLLPRVQSGHDIASCSPATAHCSQFSSPSDGTESDGTTCAGSKSLAMTSTGHFRTMDIRPPDETQLQNNKTVHYQDFGGPVSAIAVGLTGLDIGHTANIRIKAYASEVTNTSFQASLESWADTLLYEASMTFVKISSGLKDVQIGVYNTQEQRSWSQPQLTHAKRINFATPFDEPPKVITWLQELDMDNSKGWRIRVYPTDIDERGFTVHADSWADSILYSVGVTWLAYPSNRLDMTSGKFNTMDVRPWDSPQADNVGTCQFQQEGRFLEVPNVVMAINSFDYDKSQHLRLRLIMPSVTTKGITWQLQSWGDSIMYSSGASFFAWA